MEVDLACDQEHAAAHSTVDVRSTADARGVRPFADALGGYINRAKERPPGPLPFWIGLHRMYDFVLAYQTFGPDAGTYV